MLVTLLIRNFGLIERAELEFAAGLNVITGETGAGKSVLIEAIQLVLGGRASVEYIRSGADRAQITATFHIKRLEVLNQRLEEWGISPEEDGVLVLSREIVKNGRSSCRISGQAVPLGFYREVGGLLADMHGQFESHSLLSSERQRELLDRFGGPKVLSLLELTGGTYRKWRDAKQELQRLQESCRDKARSIDMLRYQVMEITSASLIPGEEESLEEERVRLGNADKLLLLARECYDRLYGMEDNAASVQLGAAIKIMTELARMDGNWKQAVEPLEGAMIQIIETSRELAAYKEEIESNPARLNEVETRLELIRGLKRKYGDTIEDILMFKEKAVVELELLEGAGERLQVLESEVKALEESWREKAVELDAARRQAAVLLEKVILNEFKELEMKQAAFHISVGELPEPHVTGMNSVEYLISPNVGEPLRPLAKIASGGELSRVMLAVKTILSSLDDTPTLVFDEIDIGIGGQALQAVAAKLAGIGRKRQVICVTHAAQVACRGEAHFCIAKVTEGGRTFTIVKPLCEELRVEELARMLGGSERNAKVLEHARHMLSEASRDIY